MAAKIQYGRQNVKKFDSSWSDIDIESKEIYLTVSFYG